MSTQLPTPQKGVRALQFSVHVYCAQTAGWIQMLLRWGRPRPRLRCVRCLGTQIPLKGARPTVFGPCLLWPKGWMDEDDTWYGSRHRSRKHCVRQGPSSPPTKEAQQFPLFRSMSIVATVAVSPTAELFYWWLTLAV